LGFNANKLKTAVFFAAALGLVACTGENTRAGDAATRGLFSCEVGDDEWTEAQKTTVAEMILPADAEPPRGMEVYGRSQNGTDNLVPSELYVDFWTCAGLSEVAWVRGSGEPVEEFINRIEGLPGGGVAVDGEAIEITSAWERQREHLNTVIDILMSGGGDSAG
jgi:hypothetical protein